jgi:hypothetical protein
MGTPRKPSTGVPVVFDMLLVRRWHHEFSPFVCRSCGVAADYAVDAAPAGPEGDAPRGGATPTRTVAPDALTLSCRVCSGTTLFPRARLERFHDIAEASALAGSSSLQRTYCDTCSGFGIRQWAPSWCRTSGLGDGPCLDCLGAGFLWTRGLGAAQWTYAEILGGLPFPEIA